MSFSLSRNERFYAQIQSAIGTIPNTAGAATLAGGDAFLANKISLNPTVVMLDSTWKTGSRSKQGGVLGRKAGAWTGDFPLMANGTPGVKPDYDPILEALFGTPGTVNSGTATITGATNAAPIVITATAHGFASNDMITNTGVLGNTAANGTHLISVIDANTFSLLGSVGNGAYTSGGSASRVNVKYALSDSIPSFMLGSFRTPGTLQQRLGFGCVAQEATFNLGQDVAGWNASGESLWVLDSDNFSTSDATQKGGLTAFPVEPGSPVTNGGIIAGFTGRAVLDGSIIANIKNATVKISTGNQLVKDSFGSYYPDSAEGDERAVTIDFTLDDQDDAATKNLYAKFLSKAAIEVVLQIGTIAGSIYLFHLKGVQLNGGEMNDGQRRFQRSFSCRAHGSSLAALDEVALWVA